MRWVSYRTGGAQPRSGYLEGDQLVDLGETPLEAWLSGARVLDRDAAHPRLALDEVELLQPILRPGKILAIGLNYAAHAAESVSFANLPGEGVQKWFNKQATAANAPYAPVHLPKVSDQLDYEGELVVVIGRHGRHVPAERAMEIVAGFAVGCDYSVRDWQKASPTMIMGKGFDTHAPFGPWIVTPDEVADLARLSIRTWVSGELRQEGTAGQMIHTIPQQIAHLTAAFTLEPGDVLFTGTPAGVGAGHDPPRFLKIGDRVRVEIDGIGAIENQIIAEPGGTRID